MKKLFLLLALLLDLAGVQAQIPAEVTEVMDKCRTAMSNPAGIEYKMDTKVGIGPLSLKMKFVVAEKGALNRIRMTTKILSMEMTTESGFDGTNNWELKHTDKGDTIILTKGTANKSNDGELDLDLDRQYRRAKMKTKNNQYEITFSDPKDKTSEVKSVTVRISANDYTMREVRSGLRGAKVTMTISKIRVGIKDGHFKPPLARYPDAVVIRR